MRAASPSERGRINEIGAVKRYFVAAVVLLVLAGCGYFVLPQVGAGHGLLLNTFCEADETGAHCIREWISPIAAVFTVAAIWYAARSVVEANRASDAAVRSTLDTFRAQLAAERNVLAQMMESKDVQHINSLRNVTRGGWIHARGEFGELEPIFEGCLGFKDVESALEAPAFGGELGQRRKELRLLIHQIDLDYRRCRNKYESDRKISAETLDDIRFRTKAFLGMLHMYQIVVDEEIEVTSEAINEYDDENLHRVRKALLNRAERQWHKRRKGIFEHLAEWISVPIKLIARPRSGSYFEDKSGVSGRAPSPHHVKKDFELVPKSNLRQAKRFFFSPRRRM